MSSIFLFSCPSFLLCNVLQPCSASLALLNCLQSCYVCLHLYPSFLMVNQINHQQVGFGGKARHRVTFAKRSPTVVQPRLPTMVFQTRAGFQLAGRDSDRDASNAQLPLPLSSFRLRMASQHCSPLAPFASISSNILRNLGAPSLENANSRLETSTSVGFPVELCHKASPCSGLAGLGVRAKRILGIKNINIYALGIYVDSAAAKKSLGSHHKSKSEDALHQDQELFDDVINGTFEKSLRLVISYGSLKRTTFLDALQERLDPQLKKNGDTTSMEQFKQQFDDVTFHKGTEIVFVQEGSKLVTKIDGQQKGFISSPGLCRALFNIYLGSDPVAPEAKATFGKSIAAVLKA